MNGPGQAPPAPVTPPALAAPPRLRAADVALPPPPPRATGVAPPPGGRWRGAWRAAGGDALRLLRGLALAGLGAALLLLAAAGALAWRLSQAPLPLDWLAPRVEAAARARGVPLSLSGLALGWSGFRDPGAPLRVVLRDPRLGPPDRPVATAARLEASLALLPLASGRVVPGVVSLDAARFALVREADGLHLADGTPLAPPSPPGLPAPPAPASPADTASPANTAPSADAASPGLPPWLADLDDLQATDTRVTVLDRTLAVTWAVSAPRVTLRREVAGLVGDASATLSVQPLPDTAPPDTAPPDTAPPDTAPPDAASPDAALPAPGASVRLQASLRPAPDRAGWSVARVRLDPLVPATLGRLVPRLPDGIATALAALDLPLSLSAEATLDPALSPRRFAATLDATAGRVTAGGATLGVSALVLRGEGTPERATLTLERLAMAAPPGAHAPPPTFSGTATLSRDPSELLARAELGVDHADFAELADYWPPAIARNAQAWITRNITAGTAHDGRFDLTLRAAPDGSDPSLTAAAGQLLADDATLHWLRPVPPLEHMQARMVLEGPDALSVATRGGTEDDTRHSTGTPGPAGAARHAALDATGAAGGVQLGAGLVRITGLSAKDQVATIGVELHGAVPALVRLLSHPRLHLLSRHPPGFTSPRGRFATRLDLTVPLEADLDADRIGLRARTRAAGVHLGDVVAGQGLDDGTLDLDVTTDGLSARGTATVARMPVRLTLDMDFRAGGPAQVVQSATVRADADAARLGAAGLDLAGVVEGPLDLDARYSERRDGRATVAVAADLSAAALDVPLGWSKPAGPAAAARAVLLLDHGHLRGVQDLRADAPGLLLRGRAEAGTRGTVLHVERAVIGRTEAAGTVRFPQRPGGAVRADIAGPVLDLSPLLDTPAAASPPAAPTPAPEAAGSTASAGTLGQVTTSSAPAVAATTGRAGTPWVLDARFARVLLGRGRSIAPVSGHAEHDGRRLDAAQLHAGEGDGSLLLTVSAQSPPGLSPPARPVPASTAPPADAATRRGPPPAPGTVRHVELQAADAGALLSSLDLTDQVRGGRLTLGGTLDQDRPGHPVDATLRLDGFNLLDAPGAGRLLQGVTLFGLVDLLHGPGLHVGRLDLPFRMADRVIDIHDARATSVSLGATAAGRIDLAAHSVDIAGTIVPAYLPNQLPGRLPVVGRLFSPEPGGGVFAATYTVRGPLDAPKVSVNPLAMLAPGFVRRLLGLP